MPAPEVGLRERKKAAQKIAIMEAVVAELESRELTSIRIEDLCAGLGISKVTFFSYFGTKEQVIEYYVHRWAYRLRGELAAGHLSGRPAVQRVFDSVGTHPAAQRIMNAVMLFFLKQDHYTPMGISEYEYSLFDPDAYARGTLPGGVTDLFSDALVGTEYDKRRDTLVPALSAAFYGVALSTKIRGGGDLTRAYRGVVGLLLRPDASAEEDSA